MSKFQVGDWVYVKGYVDLAEVVAVSNDLTASYPYTIEFKHGQFSNAAEDELSFIPFAKAHTPPPNPTPWTLPNGYATNYNSFDNKDLDTHKQHVYGQWGPTEDERKKRREAGECEECGAKLPMSIWGLGDCPSHPKPNPDKQ